VLRSDRAVVIIDLDGDGHEATGWTVMYLHIATEGRIAAGTWVAVGDKIGHPSCEGGVADGTHFHIARKYNGEWIEADGPLPFNLDGWIAHFGEEPYLGSLTRDNQVVIASRTAAPPSFRCDFSRVVSCIKQLNTYD
jgi:LasA protease